MSDLEELLAPYRASETQESAIVLLGDDDAMRVLIAFGNAEHAWRAPKRKLPETMAGRWAWIVSGHHIDLDFIATAARVSDETALSKVRMLFANRLVYPDGSMAKAARTALNAHAASKLGYKPAKRPAQAPQQPDTKDK